MKIHTVFITHNRLELTKQAIESYLETVTHPSSYVVVDNGSEDGTLDWLGDNGHPYDPLRRNAYPGFAANTGWDMAPVDATHLHRADNDFAFLPGWCEEVERIFSSEKVGQVGLRTSEEENHEKWNVGGNCVIRRELWDRGLRYDERPWPQIREEVGIGFSEDSFLSPAVVEMGYTWTRVKRPCIRPLSVEDPDDPYYKASWGARGLA